MCTKGGYHLEQKKKKKEAFTIFGKRKNLVINDSQFS